ncbi:MAG: Sensor histidine kinase RcsC [Bacteroidetes bacterium ADurb.Bin008]|nr:MAG: Sensor histidine kinase RcsC [Bacteroidetes bacterium ADurb.Bin008]
MTTISGEKIWVVDQAGMTSNNQCLDEGLLDITDRKLMEDLLTMNERRFRNMIENVSDLILVVNREGKFLYVSPSVYKKLNYPVDEFSKHTILHYINPNDRQTISDILSGNLAMDGFYEISVQHSSGQFIMYEFRASLLDEHNVHEGIVLNARNVSERVKARNELQLNLQREQELNRQKSHFISTVSHEFKTPITTISLNTQMLTKNITQGQHDKVQVNIDRIVSAEKRLIALLNEVALISRDQSGMLQFNPEPWDLHLLLDDLLEHISYLIQSNVKVIIRRGVNRQVYMDNSLLLHIAGNLLSNAVKYTPKESKVFFSLTAQGNELEVMVKDHGVGIPAKELEFLFQPYFRASNSKDYKGSGLGLSIVKRCVDLHRGQISIESKENSGTTARCLIPLDVNSVDGCCSGTR